MLRKLGIGFIVLAALAPGLAAALGVGEYQLNSYLNQPLDMTVRLHDVKGLSADQVIVDLASQDQFDAAGVDRTFFLNDLKFDVQVNGDNGEVHITSSKPVREPYLDFLVRFLWPTGRLMREYTVLLDPPSYGNTSSTVAPASASRPAKPVAPQRHRTPAPAAAPKAPMASHRAATSSMASSPAQASSAEPAAPPATQDQGPANSGETYRVAAADTMWRIASNHRPAESVSVQQTMMAIQEMNPDAFINHNVNLVRRGSVLRLPSERQIRQISSRQALSRVASQNRQWRRMLKQKGISAPGHAPVDASGRQQANKGAGAGNDEGRVTLVTPKSTQGVKDGDTTGAGGGNGSANTAALQNELAIRDENLDRLDRANKELSSRVDDLGSQVDNSQKLLKLRSQQIAALQNELRKLQKEKGVKVDPELLKAPAESAPQSTGNNSTGNNSAADNRVGDRSVTAQGKAAPGSVEHGATDQDSAGQASTASPGNTAMTNKAAKPLPKAKPAKPKPAQPAHQDNDNGVVDLVKQNLLYLGAALVVILLLIMLLVRRRRGDRDEGGDAGHPDHGDDGDNDLDGAPLMGATGAVDDLGEPPEEDLQDESMDPMERADVYVAYGQYPQAVDYLRNEINQEPSRADLKIRLLELLQEMGDDKGFHQQVAMFAGTSPVVDTAIKRLGGDPASGTAGDDEELSLDDLEMDLASDLSDSDASGEHQQAADEHDEMALDDFDFTLDDDEAEKAPAALKDEQPLEFNDLVLNDPEPERDADGTLDFSLDHEDEDGAGFTEEELSALDTVDEDGDSAGRDDTGIDDLNLDDLDLDLDLDEGGDQAAPVAENHDSPLHEPRPAGSESLDELDIDDHDLLDADGFDPPRDAATDPVEYGDTKRGLDDSDQPLDGDDLDLSLDDLDLDDTDHRAESHPETPEANADSDGDSSLDLSDLDLAFDDERPTDADVDRVADSQSQSPMPVSDSRSDADDGRGSDDMLGDDDDFDFLGETDENATKLDLARAYVDMGDAEGARDILTEVLSEGSDDQQNDARDLLARIG